MMLRPDKDGLLDVVMDNGVVNDIGFETVVFSSLLLNRRASLNDQLPPSYTINNGDLEPDRQGWVGDAIDLTGRIVGSKMWLLDQELVIEETRSRVDQYINECLAHLVEDGYAIKIVVDTKTPSQNRYDAGVDIYWRNGNILSLRVNYETGGVYVL